ncbi:PLP-dependent transferase [Physcia stellaris]|nr:PLP-dependent transferase [Physcia stellaris]
MNGSTRGLINLLRGWPNPALLPAAQIKAAAASALSDPEVSTPGLLYGPDAGYEPLRQQLATWLTSFYRPSQPIEPERICISGGASQNLACILQVFSDPVYTRHVWMVSPTYFNACRIFEDSGFGGRLRSVPEDDEGIDIVYLEQELQKAEKRARLDSNDKPEFKSPRTFRKIYRHLVYAVPTFSNPSSMTMSLQRRQQLVSIARRYDALIITDDVYDQLQWPTDSASKRPMSTEAALPRIVDIDRTLDGGCERPDSDGFGNSVSNGSFSKIVGPGVRTGWAEGTKKLAYGLSQCGSSRSGGAPSQLTATFMSNLLESGELQHHIVRTLQPAYARRYYSLMSAINRYLVPLGVELPQEDRDHMGGYFVWFALPPPLDATRVAVRAKEAYNLIVAPGVMFGVNGDAEVVHLKRRIRVCFAWEQEAALEEGIARLGEVVRDMQKELDKQGPEDLSTPVNWSESNFR